MNFRNIMLMLFATAWVTVSCTSSSVTTATTPADPLTVDQPVTPTQTASHKFHVATGPSDSDWYQMGSGMVSVLNEQIPGVLADVKETTGLMENVDLLTAGKAGLAFVYDYHVVLANQGRLMSAFPDAPIEKLTIKCGTEIERPMFPEYGEPARIVVPLYEERLYIIASRASGISSVTDLKGRHVSTGTVNSATEQQARYVINGLGIGWEDEIIHEQFDSAAAIDALQNGQIDALFWSGYSPSTGIADLLNIPDSQFILIPIDNLDAEKIMRFTPGVFHQSTIPVGSFPGISGDLNTLAVTVVLAAMEDFPAEAVHQIVPAIFSETDSKWVDLPPLTPETAVALLHADSQSYLHPGAKDAFVELRAMK